MIDTAYTSRDVELLLDAIGGCDNYILISSSAVYPEYSPQPFREETKTAANKYWGKYGTDKIEAEEALMRRKPDAYILSPPYLYGPMNNVYREAFVFECALSGRKFYLPKDGGMRLQFFHIQDLCRLTDILLKERPCRHIFNTGNKETVSVRDWALLCYRIAEKEAEFVNVYNDIDQRNYFSFSSYEYYLDVSAQYELMPCTKPLSEGLKEAFAWYLNNSDQVRKRPYLDYIDNFIA